MWTEAVWQNKSKKITGKWIYNWAADSFTIILNSKDRITGQRRTMTICNDTPEWGNWKLVRK